MNTVLQATDYALIAVAFGPFVGAIGLFLIMVGMVVVKSLFGSK